MAEPSRIRFAEVSNADVEEVMQGQAKSTTKQWVKAFNDFVAENGMECNLQTCTKEQLCSVLCKCYVGIRTSKKEFYQFNS